MTNPVKPTVGNDLSPTELDKLPRTTGTCNLQIVEEKIVKAEKKEKVKARNPRSERK